MKSKYIYLIRTPIWIDSKFKYIPYISIHRERPLITIRRNAKDRSSKTSRKKKLSKCLRSAQLSLLQLLWCRLFYMFLWMMAPSISVSCRLLSFDCSDRERHLSRSELEWELKFRLKIMYVFTTWCQIRILADQNEWQGRL